MSELETQHLRLPFIAAAQAQKHVTHNEALKALDAIVQLAVRDADRTAPPDEPADGDRHIIADDATGAWTGRDGAIAARVDGAWLYATPEEGWLAYDISAGALLVRRDAAWEPLTTGGGGLETVAMLGVNATADATNRLAVRSPVVLLSAVEDADGGSGDIRIAVSKETAADTASVVFQDASSGRAEIGLAGDDDLVVKVSADGSAWTEALRIDKDTGLATLAYDNALSGLVAETVQDALDELAAGGGGGGGTIVSVFGRSGAVTAAGGDYDASQIDNDSGVAGASVKDALDALASAKQAADSDLTAIAGLSPSNDDVLQRKAGAWTNRTPAQLKADLALAKGDVGLGNVTNDAQLKAASNLSDVANAATAFANIKQAASETASGAVELATVGEVQARSDTLRAVTPAGLAAVTRERLTADRTLYVRTAPVNASSITNASPAVVNATAHGLQADDPVVFGTSGSLPTGLTVGTVYYVLAAGLTANAFRVAATPGGTAINTTGAGSGTHSFQTGNDANPGDAATRSGALLGIQEAYNRIAADVDLSGRTVTIQLANGTYADGVNIAIPWTGAGAVAIEGANTTGAIVAGIGIAASLPGTLTISRMRLAKAGGVGVMFEGRGTLVIGANVDFGACSYHVFQNGPGSYVQATNGYTISGGAGTHAYVSGPCFFQVEGGTVTLSGTPAFSTEFLNANNGCYARITATFSGSGTGKRYTVTKNASVEVNGAGASYLPGNAAGTTATGGQYN